MKCIILTLSLYIYRKFKIFLAVNRWIYDKSRGIPIDTKNPQRAHSVLVAEAAGGGATSSVQPINIVQPVGRNPVMLQRSSRLAMSKSKQEADQKAAAEKNVDVAADNDAEEVEAVARKTKIKPTRAPNWDNKMNKKLTATVKKCIGQGRKGAISWAAVVKEMGTTKHHCQSQWDKIKPRAPEKVHVESENEEDEEDEEEDEEEEEEY